MTKTNTRSRIVSILLVLMMLLTMGREPRRVKRVR